MAEVPVSRALPNPGGHERVYASMSVDEDLIATVKGHGAATQQVEATEIYDLRFGLRMR